MNKWILIIVLTGFAVYFNSLFNGFVWDDEEQIVNNPTIRSFANLSQIFSSGTFNSGGAVSSQSFFRPVVTIYYTLVYQFFGQQAWGYHLLQIIIHLTSAILIYRLTGLGWAGLLFAIHPAISKTIVYAASIGDALYTLFALIALNFHKKIWVVGITVLLALYSKESAIALIILLPIYGSSIFPILIAATIYFLTRFFYGINLPELHLAPIAQASLVTRLMTIPSEFGHYLRLVFWPSDLTISLHWIVYRWQDPRFWAWGLIIVFLIIGIVKYAKSKFVRFWLFWISLSFLIVSNIIPLDGTVDETWLYFPMVGIVILVIYLIPKLGKFYPYLLVVIVFGLSFRTIIRNRDWKDGLTLYSRAINISPPSYELENNYGVELFRRGQYDQAKIHFENSIKLQPNWWFAYNNLGAINQRQNNLIEAERLYRESIKRADYFLAYENLGIIIFNRGNHQEISNFLQIALKKFPNNITLNEISRLNNLRPKQ